MPTHRTVLVIADSDNSDHDYEHQLQQDSNVAYKILTEQYNTPIMALSQSQQIDGILLKLHFPHSNSIKLLRQLKEQMGDRCPPIVVIDSGDTKVAVQAFKNGAVDYLVRDQITADDLRLAMRSAIDNAKLREELQRSQEQFQTSVENMLDCFGIFSAMRDESGQILDFRIDYLNGAACENNRMPKAMQIGRGLCEVLPAHRESGLFDEYCRLVETAQPLIKDSLIYDDTYGEQHLVRAFDIRATKLNDGFVASWRDVTERKRLELELSHTVTDLQSQQSRLQRLIDTAPIGIAIGSLKGNLMVMNDTMLRLYGYTRQAFEQQGINWRDLIPPELAQTAQQNLEQLRDCSFLPPQETELLHPDGSRVPILLSATQWMDHTDEHVIFAVDLSQQKQAEAAIQQLNRDLTNRVVELQSLLDIIPVGIAIADDPTCSQMQNNAYLRQMLGVDPGNNISKSAPTDEQPPYQVFQNGQEISAENLPMQVAAKLGVDVRDAEFDILLPDGTVHQLLSYATPLRDEQNQIRGVVGAFLDITERNQDAAALKASQQRYRELAEAMPQMVWTADATGMVNYWNQRWYEYTGLSEVESMGLAGADTVHPDERDRTLRQWSQAIANGNSFEIEYRIRHWDGEYHWFICRAIPTRDSQNQITGWIGTITNIDDIKRSEALVQQSQQQLQQQLAEIEAIYQSAPIGLNVLDTELRFVRINQRLADINGLPIEAHIGRSVRELFPDLADTIEQLLHPILKTGEPLLNVEIHGETPAQPGVQRTWLEHFLPLKAGDQVVGISTVCEEITERIQIQTVLRASEERFRHMADNAPVMIWVTDPTGYCTYLNQGWYNFTGQTEETGLGFGWLDAVHPEDSESSKNVFLSATNRQQAFRLEYRLRCKDGEYRSCIDTASPWFGEAGEFKGYIGSVIDISDVYDELRLRKQAESALRLSEERYRTLFETMNEGFCVAEVLFDEHNKAVDYRLLEINSVFEKHSGLKQAQGKTARELLPDLEPFWFELYGNVVLTGEPVRYENYSGAMNRWFDVSAFRIGQPGSRKVAILFEDISDRKRSEAERQQAQAALHESENRLRLALESTELGTWDLNPITAVLKWDDQCKAMFGLSPQAEINYDVFLAGLHPLDRDRTHQVVLQSLNPESGGEYDIEYRTVGIEDGIERWVAAKGKTFFNAAGVAIRFIGTVLNITEKKRAEAEREQLLQREQAARAEAERANRIKDEFLAVLSHELRSPLNPILGWTKLLQVRKFDETQTSQALAIIERNAKLQTQLIDDLLDIAKILRGKLSLNMACVNLSFVIEAAIETVKTAAVAKSISLHPVLPKIGQVSGDTARLQQIIWNLLSNAIKFTPTGGRVDIQLDRVGNQAEITVRDTGRGISPDFLPYIFESFRQEDASITRKYGGLGLGLAIVRQLVEAHGGMITADSPGEGLGATFTVQLPLLNLQPEIKQIDELPQQELDLTGIRVLAVDDDADTRELLTILLTQYGAEVLTVASAAEVLANLQSFQPDVLVSDLGMPEVDGYTLIQQVRSLSSAKGGQIPAIALTAYAREDDHQQTLSSGYQRHITKPLEPEQLVQAVVALTRSKCDRIL
ncbi:PAS domain S-box protein [Nostoc sp. UHCC 0702]|nr:PAS domain S-box protein [Nostoc sp. UHCC 0702]